MRAELNFEPDMMDETSALIFGYLVERGAKEGASLVIIDEADRKLIAYHFGRETQDSDMFGGSAFGTGQTLTEAFVGVLDDLGVTLQEVERK